MMLYNECICEVCCSITCPGICRICGEHGCRGECVGDNALGDMAADEAAWWDSVLAQAETESCVRYAGAW